MCRVNISLLVLLIVFGVVGCGSDSGSNIDPLLAEFQGQWGVCFSGTSTYSEEIVFRGDEWASYFVDYADSDCVTPTNISQTGQGTIDLGDKVTTSSGVIARKIDIVRETDATYFNIYYINQNQMYLGDSQTGDTTSDENRPTEINFDFSYEKRAEVNIDVGQGSFDPIPGDSSTASSDTLAPVNGGSSGDVNAPPMPIDLTTLEGAWKLCDGTGSGVEIEFSSGSYFVYSTTYDGVNCGTVVDVQLAEQGLYVIGNSITTSSQLVVNEIDITNDLGGTQYDLYYIDQGQLYFGDSTTGAGTSPETRPTDLNFTVSFIKVR